MEIKLMNLEQDKEIIDTWCKERQLDIIPMDYLSKYGFLVSSETQKPLCAGWLFLFTDCKRCTFACIISNPNTTKEERNEALNLLFTTMILSAKDMNCKYITFNSAYMTLKKQLLDLNFKEDKKLPELNRT